MDTKSDSIALFIDFDNIEIGIKRGYNRSFSIGPVIKELSEMGTVVVRRAYGDWVSYQAYREGLIEHGIELIERTAITNSGKNGADIKIAIDAVDLALKNDFIDTFAIVSGDSDFLPLIQKLREYGKYVTVISGDGFTSPFIMKNCDKFISYETIAGIEKPHEEKKKLKDAIELLEKVILSRVDEGRGLHLAAIKNQMLRLDPSFNEKSYGFSNFGKFIRYIGDECLLPIKIHTRDSGDWYLDYFSDDDEMITSEEYQQREPNLREWGIIFGTIERCFREGEGKYTQGWYQYLIAYLTQQRREGKIGLDQNSLRAALHRLLDYGILLQKNPEKSLEKSVFQLSGTYAEKKATFMDERYRGL
ncbi:NYN domain-containing protein [Methanofollis aquaemaris]|uniref:NYN domain-containing protein n=1 Tax=Methanofollis aquaemaris TaxID=126734 RepID=A0A8A3S2W5_9EURY|nr:NYN domain-containing protein [Methanofollis aquaemaris]QSZ66475.1 NYN domain-containing protein [Methanofollis aquaemaris]